MGIVDRGGGCRTCRTRRVKCDRVLPRCNRCVTTGRVCDGNQTPLPQVNSHKSRSVVKPIKSAAHLGLGSPLSAGRVSALTFNITGYEQHAHHFWHSNILPGMRIATVDSEWLDVTLQLSTTQPHIYQAMAAIAGAGKAVLYVHDGMLERPKDYVLLRKAMNQYSKSMVSLRQHMSSLATHHSLDAVLLASVLLMGFEIMLDARDSKVTHHRDFCLRIVNDDTQRHRLGMPAKGRDELASFLNRMCPDRYPPGPILAPGMDPPMDTLTSHEYLLSSEERQCAERIYHSADAFIREQLKLASGYFDTLKVDRVKYTTRYCLVRTLARLAPQVLPVGQSDLLESLRRQSTHLTDSLLQRISRLDDLQSSPSNLLLSTRLLLFHILLYMSDTDDEIATDELHAHFSCLLVLCTRYIDVTDQYSLPLLPAPIRTRQKEYCVMEHEMLPLLNMMVYRCRHHDLRRSALHLLRTCNRREGMNGGVPLGMGAGWIANVEDKLAADLGASGAEIPGGARMFEAVIIHEPYTLGLLFSQVVRVGGKIIAIEVFEYAAGGPPLPMMPIRSRRFPARVLGLA